MSLLKAFTLFLNICPHQVLENQHSHLTAIAFCVSGITNRGAGIAGSFRNMNAKD